MDPTCDIRRSIKLRALLPFFLLVVISCVHPYTKHKNSSRVSNAKLDVQPHKCVTGTKPDFYEESGPGIGEPSTLWIRSSDVQALPNGSEIQL